MKSGGRIIKVERQNRTAIMMSEKEGEEYQFDGENVGDMDLSQQIDQELSDLERAYAQESAFDTMMEAFAFQTKMIATLIFTSLLVLFSSLIVMALPSVPEMGKNVAISSSLISVFALYFLFEQIATLTNVTSKAKSMRDFLRGRIAAELERERLYENRLAHG